MPLNDAIKFIDTIKEDKSLRESLYICDGPEDMSKHLEKEGFKFNYNEIDDAYRSLLLKCQFEEDANLLTEVYNMYRMLNGMSLLSTPK